MTAPFGLTPAGFNAMRLADVKQFLDNAFVAQFGDINLDPQSVFGQEIGVLSKSFADYWENLEDVYFSQYPNSASGVSLDNVVQFNGITRLPSTQTSVIAVCTGLEGTLVPQNALASIPSNGDTFYANLGGTITSQNAYQVTASVTAVLAQSYFVTLSNQTFVYSKPIITFTNSGAIFVTGNQITLTINGITQTPIPFTTNSNNTLGLLASQISAFGSGLQCVATATNPNIISIVPNAGFNVSVNVPVQITGGATQASSALTFAAPANQNAITAALTALINAGTPDWTATDNMDGTFNVTANDPADPFSAAVGSGLSLTSRATPISFLSENYGPVACPANSLTQIVTPIAGWNSVTNPVAGVTGTFLETDAELRIRRLNSVKLLGNCTVEAIEAQLLQNVPGVTSAVVFENVTLTQQSIVLSFPAVFQSGDVITVVYNTSFNFMVNFTTNQATTMGLLVAAFEALPGVASATFGGAGNKVVTVNMEILQDLTVNSASTNVSAQTAFITGGRPPKSFEAVVQGGSNDAIANQIWKSKPAGIQTYGNTSVSITDSQGNSQTIFFSRPTEIFIQVQVALTLYTPEAFPTNGIQLVEEAIYNYGSGLGVGVSVLLQRVLSQIFTVPGIASGDMLIAATTTLTQTPVFGTADITIADNEVSVWNLETISVTVA